MIFASNVFLFLFLPVFLLCYYIAKDHWRSYVIVLGSYLFYAWWRPDFLLLFVAISYWNYWFGLRIKARVDAGEKKIAFRLLTVGVIGNLATLGYFKYANFAPTCWWPCWNHWASIPSPWNTSSCRWASPSMCSRR